MEQEIRNILKSPFSNFDLTDAQREAAELVGLYGLTLKEAGYRIGITPQAVYLRLRKACDQMGLPSSKHLPAYILQRIRDAAGME